MGSFRSFSFISIFALLACVGAQSAFAVGSDDFEFHGYLRSGVRANNSDTPTCFKNKGPAQGINEFRLGNECEDYGELNFVAHQLKAKTATDPFFKTNITLNFSAPKGFTQGESLNPGLIEAYFDSGNFFDSTVKYWFGKRFYRDAAVHMNDDFYFANINGNGAGIYDVRMPTGKFALAYFLEQTNSSNTGATTTLSKGHFIDARWSDLVLDETNHFDLWAMYGNNRGGNLNNTAGAASSYDSLSGYAVGAKHKYLMTDGTNALSIQYGTKLMDSLTLANPQQLRGGTSLGENHRIRAVEDLVLQPMKMLGFELTARYETFHTASATTTGKWWDLGARPVYSFTDHFGFATEVGVSSVKFDSDTQASLLKRLTLAPVLRMGPKYFDRPELRVFYTTSFNAGNAFGAQGEVWF